MSEHMQVIKQWARSFRADVEAVKHVVETRELDDNARKFAASALNYLVTRMDLVPDWNETIGLLDDVMVLRICLRLANAYNIDEHLEGDENEHIAHLIDDVDDIEQFLGDDLYGKLRKYCARLSDDVVRGRSPELIISDDKVRETLYAEIEDDILRMPATSFEDAGDVAVRFKSYLHHKLD